MTAKRWLAAVERCLRVHGRRRHRVLEELRAHLEEGTAVHGEEEAVRRMGSPRQVAASFTPRLADRAFEARDRLAAAAMLAAMAASLPVAWTLEQAGRPAGSWAWAGFLALLAPTALLALISCAATLRGRPLGRRLAPVLAAMVVLTAVVVIADLPPARGAFAGYRAAVAAGRPTGPLGGSCGTRALSACAADHAAELRVNYSAGAIVLAAGYLWAVGGWLPRRRRPAGVPA